MSNSRSYPMSTVLPPRRQIPPPPPPRATHANTLDVQDTRALQALNLTARIASLQLNPAAQLSYRDAGKTEKSRDQVKPISTVPPSQSFALVLAGLDPQYLSQLLARPPPPIPDKRSHNPEFASNSPPQLPPRRRVPPRPSSPSRSDHHRTSNAHVDQTMDYTQDEGNEEGPYQISEHADTITQITEPPCGEDEGTTGLFAAGACIKCHDFSAVDTHAAQFPRQCVRSLDELAYDLTEPFSYETEKTRAIFTWMHHNIQYDVQSFFAGTVNSATPESTLSSGLAVCDGYARLFVDLAERAGLQAYKVHGHGKGFGYRNLAPGEPAPKMSTNHAWNCVLMDGEWRLLDATWGAGALNGSTYEQRFTASWFTSNPIEFARRHFPSDPTFQLIAEEDGGPLKWEDYIMAPPGPVIFGDFHRLDFLVDLLEPASSVIGNGQTVTFTLFKCCEHMANNDNDNYIHVLLISGQKPIPLQPNAEGGWSLTYRIVDQAEVSLMFIATVDGKDAKGLGIRGFNSALDRKHMTFGGLAKWTIV